MIWEVHGKMVKAELIHNPYLLETNVKFNGHEPKINSLVEKYRAAKLQDWIARLPDIFYNEMNGWDFELDFSGTKIDFEYLQAAFDGAGVSRESVRLFHKNELENVERKSAEISDLLAWLDNHPNRKFDYFKFRENYAHLFDSGYSFIMVQGPTLGIVFDEVTVENVSNIAELAQAALENTPILFYVNERNLRGFGKNLTDILCREDVRAEQLFFNIDSELNRSQVVRVIKDLCVECPQIVESPSDIIIKRYLEVYPMTAHIHQVIDILINIQSEIWAALQSENERSVNGAIRQKIDRLDETIRKLKNVGERIVQRDNFEIPAGLYTARQDFISKVQNWRKKKIKITSDSEARKIAVEFDKEIHDFFEDFIRQIAAESQSGIDSIRSRFASEYSYADFNDNYAAERESNIDLSGFEIPKLIESLLKLKREEYVQPGDSPFGIFKNMLGSAPRAETRELKREVTYLYQEWRDYATATVSPVLGAVIRNVSATLVNSYGRVAGDYLEHLRLLVEQQIALKDAAAAQFSDDERKLQEDNDWFSAFCEKLREIERG
jgi:hypothetical protein